MAQPAVESIHISWSLGGTLQHPSGKRLKGHSATLVGTNVYILCGARSAPFLKFSMETLQYKQISLGTYANNLHTATLVDDTIIFVGGRSLKGVRGMIAVFDVVNEELEIEPALKEDLLRVYHSAVFVPRRREILVFGGVRAGRVVADLVALNVDTFNVREMFAKGRHPPSMYGHGAVLHRDKMYLFGPNEALSRPEWRGKCSLTVHILTMVPGVGEAWSQVLGPQGSGFPSCKYFAMLAHESHVFMFGGRKLERNADETQHEVDFKPTNDLVAFDLTTNSFRVFGGPNGAVTHMSKDVKVEVEVEVKLHGEWPPPMEVHAPVRYKDQMVFFGGQSASMDSFYLLSFGS